MPSVYYLFTHVIEAIIVWLYCRRIFSTKHSIRIEMVTLVICYSFIYICFSPARYWSNFFFFLLFNYIYMKVCYDISYISGAIQTLILTITMSLTELGAVGLTTHYAPDFNTGTASPQSMILLLIISKILYFFALQFLSLWFNKNKNKPFLVKYSLFLCIILIISGYLLLVLSGICASYELSSSFGILISIASFLLIFVDLFSAWLYTFMQAKNQDFIEMQLLLQKEQDASQYYTALHEQNEKQNIAIHDIRKHLRSIAELNEMGEQAQIKSYLDHIIELPELKEDVRICDNNFLNTILYRMQTNCQKNQIRFYTDIRSGSIDFMSEYDMTALFDNLLENAIEASKDVSDAYIDLSISANTIENNILITMINSCDTDPFSKNKKKLPNTRKNHPFHGYGLKSVERVVQKYEGSSRYFYEESDHTFHAVIILRIYKK